MAKDKGNCGQTTSGKSQFLKNKIYIAAYSLTATQGVLQEIKHNTKEIKIIK